MFRTHFPKNLAGAALLRTGLCLGAPASAQPDKPNILIIWGDDVGMWNISAYHRGMMGGSTPNIDRIANDGMIFMDHYAQASCTARRAAFITGQYPLRTGLSTVGLPGAKEGIQESDPTLATMLRAEGYATGQFGKNHLGDRDENLPTNHGFDEFYGILYHLNAGEYPAQYDFPKDEEVQNNLKLKQRGVIHSKALPDGSQQIEDLGPWGRERQRHLDQEVLVESKRFITDAVKAGTPFFVWHNTTRMHYRTNLNQEYDGKSGYGLYADGMMELDDDVGELLALLDELGVADNTIVMFSTDNGAASNSWPDGGNQPFHGEKGVGDWKLLFLDQEKWFRSPQLSLSTPIITNLKLDPFERFDDARGYDEWAENRSWILGQVGPKMAEFVKSFQEFPPSQKSMSIQLDDISTQINSQSIGR